MNDLGLSAFEKSTLVRPMFGFGVFWYTQVSFRDCHSLVLRAMPLLAVMATFAGCLVDNPAYDPSVRNPAVDAAAPDVGVVIDAPVIDVRVGTLDARTELDAVAPDVASEAMPPDSSSPFCDSNDPALSLCLTFEGNVKDHSANAIALLGLPKFVPGIDGSAYQVNALTGLSSTANSVFVSTQLTVDMWVRLSVFPEAQLQALAVVPGVVSMAVTGQGQVVCDVGGIPARSPLNTLILNTWTSISCTYDSIGINIYANGLTAGGRRDSTIVPMVTKSTIIIGSAPGFSAFTGDIDNLRFWRKRLTPGELCKSAPECVQ